MDPYPRNSLLASVASDSMGMTQYTFNTVNQLVGVQKDGLTATYSYLPDGMRNEKTVNGVTTGHLWDGTNMVAETSGDAVVYKYVRGAGLLYAENATDEKTWYVKDAHGDTVQLTDGNGNIVWNYAYDAFGNQKEAVNSGTEPYNPFRYTGEYFDAETGFIYLRARYMNPETGRFISEDPVGDGVNWYVYAAGNPVRFFDPSGLAVTDWDRQHCTDTEIAQLEKITDAWNAAYQRGDTQQMKYTHQMAEQIRDQYRTSKEHGFDDGNTGTGNTKYCERLWLEHTKIQSPPPPPVIDFSINMGVGFAGKVTINGVKADVGVKMTLDVIDDTKSTWYGEQPDMRKIEVSCMGSICEAIKAGVSYENQYSRVLDKSIGDSLFIGVDVAGKQIGMQGDSKQTDIIVSLGAGIYFIMGGDFNVTINISEIGRKISVR